MPAHQHRARADHDGENRGAEGIWRRQESVHFTRPVRQGMCGGHIEFII